MFFRTHAFRHGLLGVLLMVGSAPNTLLLAQTADRARLFGNVLDGKTKTPLPGANLYFPELQKGTVTDAEGKFSLPNLPLGAHKLQITYIGYEKFEIALVLKTDLEKSFYLQPTVLEGREVTVISKRDQLTESKQALTVIEAKDLEKARGQTLGESLKEIPGVTTLQTGPSIAKPVIRGLHSQRIVVLNAGVQQEGQQWGGEHAPEIDPFSSSRIEVLKGAAGVQYGAGAIGGVIRVSPRELRVSPGFGGELSLNGFSNNLQGAGALLFEGASKRFAGWGWRVQGSARKAGDAQSPDFKIQNSAFTERDWTSALGYHNDRTGLELYYSHFGTELGIYRGAHIGNVTDLLRAIERGEPTTDTEFSYDVKPPKQDISHNLLSIKGHHQIASLGRVEMQYGWQQNHRQEFDAHKPFSSEPPTMPSFDLTLTTYTADVGFHHNPIKNFFGHLGITGMRQGNVQSGTVFLIPNFRAYSGGAFIHESWTNGKLTFDGGARYDYRRVQAFLRNRSNGLVTNVHEYGNFTGVGGLIYQFAHAWSLGANIGSAWRPPSLNELYSNGVHHGTAQFEVGDLQLKSERSFNLDATLRHVSERTRLEVSAYRNRMSDFIFLFPAPEPTLTVRGAFPTFRYQQANAVLRGLEGLIEYRLAAFLQIGASASLVRGDNRETDEPLIQMPADRGRLDLDFTLPDFGAFTATEFEVITTFVRRQTRFPENADYADPPPGYTLFDLNASTHVKLSQQTLRFNFSVRNLFDVSYRDYLSRFRYFIDDAGRDVVLRVQIPFGDFDRHTQHD